MAIEESYFTFMDPESETEIGVDSRQYNVKISNYDGLFNISGREFEAISIEGRDGDLIIDKGRRGNATVRFTCFIRSDFINKFGKLIKDLTDFEGYRELEVDGPADIHYTDPEEDHYEIYRGDAYFVGVSVREITPDREMGSFDLIFSAKPGFNFWKE